MHSQGLCQLCQVVEQGQELFLKNEATLRFVLGDPIMVMICDTGNLEVC